MSSLIKNIQPDIWFLIFPGIFQSFYQLIFFYLFRLYNVIPLRTNGEVIVEKVGGGEVCFSSSFLSYSIVISSHKKIKNIIINVTRKKCLLSKMSLIRVTYGCINSQVHAIF